VNGGAGNCSQGQRSETFMCNHLDTGAESPEQWQLILNASEIEREELDWLLNSGVLGRSHNLARMLKFICEKHFEGKASQITEHRARG
jgi:hypothetical protein